MNPDSPQDLDTDTDPGVGARQVLLAASRHDLETLRALLHTHSASVQDPETGSTPLHAAIAGVDFPRKSPKANDALNGEHVNKVDQEEVADDAAVGTVKLLLQNGAIWNDLDKNDETLDVWL